LPAATRQALVAASPRYRFLLAQGRASAERPGIETEFPALVDAMVALAALAGGGRRVRDAWTAFAEEVGGRLSPDSFVHGDLRFEGEVEGRPLLFEVGADGIAVRRELGVRDAPCFEVAPRQPLVSQAGAALLALRPQAESEWQDLQPARLRYDGRQIAVSWDGYLPERDRLLRAARLLAAVETGPYR
jgi:hypothetical protein